MPDAVIDLQLDVIVGDEVFVCSAQPVDYTQASATYMLATQAVTGANFVKANGDTSGRKVTITPPVDSNIANSGTSTHVAIANAGSLRHVTTCNNLALVAGQQVTIQPYQHEIGDPT